MDKSHSKIYKDPTYKDTFIFLLKFTRKSIKDLPHQFILSGIRQQRIQKASTVMSFLGYLVIYTTGLLFLIYTFFNIDAKLSIDTQLGVFFILTLVTLVSFFIFSVFSKKISIALIRYQYKKHNYNEIERKYLNLEMSIRYHSFNNDGKDDNFIERDVYSNTLTSDFHFKVEYKKAYPVPDFNLFKLWIDYILHLITFKRG
mgnify:CR=1 FL=1